MLPIIHFVIFTLLNCPPNFLWQEYLEQQFPGYTTSTAVDDGGKGVTVEKKLDMGNTIKKFILDQTVGATLNTVLFTAVISALKGSSGGDIVDAIKQVRSGTRGAWAIVLVLIISIHRCSTLADYLTQDFWPVAKAGLKLWPLVSLLNFTVVPVQRRILVGSLVGVGWGIYLSLIAAG